MLPGHDDVNLQLLEDGPLVTTECCQCVAGLLLTLRATWSNFLILVTHIGS
jgi:hypothetical protein